MVLRTLRPWNAERTENYIVFPALTGVNLLWGKAFLYACLIAITEATCHKIRFSKENKQVLQNECFQMNNQQEQNTIEIEGRLFIITEAKITLKQSITTHKHPRLPRATKTAYT